MRIIILKIEGELFQTREEEPKTTFVILKKKIVC